jgi:hypothetical protein
LPVRIRLLHLDPSPVSTRFTPGLGRECSLSRPRVQLLDVTSCYLIFLGYEHSTDHGGVRNDPGERCMSSHRLRVSRATFGRRRESPLPPPPPDRPPAPHHRALAVAGPDLGPRLHHRPSVRAQVLDLGHRPGSGRRSPASRRRRTTRPLPPPSRAPPPPHPGGPGTLHRWHPVRTTHGAAIVGATRPAAPTGPASRTRSLPVRRPTVRHSRLARRSSHGKLGG